MAIFEGPDANRNIIIIAAVVVVVAIIYYLYTTGRLPGIHQQTFTRVPQGPPSVGASSRGKDDISCASSHDGNPQMSRVAP